MGSKTSKKRRAAPTLKDIHDMQSETYRLLVDKGYGRADRSNEAVPSKSNGSLRTVGVLLAVLGKVLRDSA